ncbi:oligopeptide transporter [Lasius niger]|uniref:Oligopeptide transporter n=1 Tax=Lasius niger TaxID=67767 RepID=A0A0J7NA08_LASNI|nr:oligopeptide transporter [Lasius niger]
MGMRLGMTVASSIPAAIISMAVLRRGGRGSLLENNLVQTQASAAGCLSAVFMTLPALVMIGWWQNFPYWQTALITLAGGIAGVLFTVPLRRCLVLESSLPYPEGTACAVILESGEQEGRKSQAETMTLLLGTIISILVSFFTSALQLASDGFIRAWKFGHAAFRVEGGFSLALLGIGYFVGPWGAAACLLGSFLAWDVIVPLLLTLHPVADPIHAAPLLWKNEVKYIAAGIIATASFWIILRLTFPLIRSIKHVLSASAHLSVPPRERDLAPLTLIILGTFALSLFSFLCFSFLGTGLTLTQTLLLVAIGAFIWVGIGFIVSSACGYMAGLLGSSSSPISGAAILAILFLAFSMASLQGTGLLSVTDSPVALAYALFLLTAIIAASAMANDNLQDLKTGSLVGASPKAQQISLLIGCTVGAATVAPVLNLLYQAYGFEDHFPRPDMDQSAALTPPQPLLMASLAKKIIHHEMDWTMLGIGAILGIFLIICDYCLKKFSEKRLSHLKERPSLPPLAVGMGLYFPASVSFGMALGALIAIFTGRKVTRSGTMAAAGFIVGESFAGIGLAVITLVSGSPNSLAVSLPFNPQLLQLLIGSGFFILSSLWFIHQARKPDIS